MCPKQKGIIFFWRVWVVLVEHKTQCPQIYIKLTKLVNNDGRKLPLLSKLLSLKKKIILACQTYFCDIALLVSHKLQHLS